VPSESTQIVVYGATGVLGREILVALEGEALEELSTVQVTGVRSAGQEVPWPGKALEVVSPDAIDPDEVDIAILATPSEASEQLAAQLRDRGALVIDCSGANHGDVTTLGPGYDPSVLEELESLVVIANPAASALAPLVRSVAEVTPVSSVFATVLVGASMSGRDGQEALSSQTVSLLSHRMPDAGPFHGVLAFNLLPDGPGTTHEMDPWARAARRDLKALVPALEGTPVHVQVVQTPIFSGVGVSTTIVCADPTVEVSSVLEKVDQTDGLLRSTEGLAALRDAMELDGSLLGNLRRDEDGALTCWIVSDALMRTANLVGDVVGRVVRDELW
jgi:aspartate-semialdehyde dehydrogenase